MNAPQDWWKTFFSGLAVDFWRAAVPAEATEADADFLWKHLDLRRGARVLDVPCGAGRLTLPLSARGCAMTGIDISREFLDLAAQAAAEQGLAVSLSCADMRAIPPSAFDAAFCFGNSFGYLDDRGNADFIDAVAAALAPRARFAIDFGQTAEGVFPSLEPNLDVALGDIRFEEETRYDARTSRIENVFRITRGEESETKLASQRVYLAGDLVRMLEGSGFTVHELFGSPAEEPFALRSQRLLIVAEKTRASGEDQSAVLKPRCENWPPRS